MSAYYPHPETDNPAENLTLMFLNHQVGPISWGIEQAKEYVEGSDKPTEYVTIHGFGTRKLRKRPWLERLFRNPMQSHDLVYEAFRGVYIAEFPERLVVIGPRHLRGEVMGYELHGVDHFLEQYADE